MEHIAIDIGGRQSQICARSSDGTILRESRVLTHEIPAVLAERPPSRVILETCAESFHIADALLRLGHEVRVVPAMLARSLGVGARRTKTDRRDAQALSEASCRMELPSVHIPTMLSRDRKALCGMRDGLVKSRTQLVNTIRGWQRTRGIRIRSGGPEYLPTRLRLACPDLPTHVARQLRSIENLTTEIEESDAELSTIANADPVCKRLMSVPGVGPVTSIRFSSSLDEIERFDGAHAAESFIGLTPGENSSSDKKQRTSITKAGPPALRWALIQAAWSARRSRPDDPMVQWSYEIEKRRGKKIAVTALARKLAGILFAIWRDGTIYNPKRGASSGT